jgi:hypothetical protein
MPGPETSAKAPRSVLAGFSLAVAVLALALSVFTFFNGSAKQTRFEASRQICVNAITEYGRTLLNIRFRDSPLTPSQQADWVIDGGIARTSCFDTHVLDPESEFASSWYETEKMIELPIAFLGEDMPDEPLGSGVEDAASLAIDRMLGGLEEALDVALTTEGPGFFPWQDSEPTSPATFPPYKSSSTPDP